MNRNNNRDKSSDQKILQLTPLVLCVLRSNYISQIHPFLPLSGLQTSVPLLHVLLC